MFCKGFILHVITSYPQHVFNVLKHCKNVLQMFCNIFCKYLFYVTMV